jgi:hypothetical protein
MPARRRRNPPPYEDHAEVEVITEKYRGRMHVFLTSLGKDDRRTRDLIAITLVRLAQKGNRLALRKLIDLIRDTIDVWIDRYGWLSRWRGYEDEVQSQIEACVRRYRYTGSFVNYLFGTLRCAARGIRPIVFLSLETDSGRERRLSGASTHEA